MKKALALFLGLIFWGLSLPGWSEEKPQPQFRLQFDLEHPQLVVTAEYMTIEELLDPKVIRLAKEHNLLVAPCIWPEDLGEELDHLMDVYEANGLQVIFWPQLSRDHCLYLNKEYAEEYLAYLDAIYAWADKYNHHIDAMIVDIEPPDCQPGSNLGPFCGEEAKKDPHREELCELIRPMMEEQTFGRILKAMGKRSFEESIPKFQAVLDKLHEHGTIAISTAMDYAAVDLAINRPVLQDLAGGPSLLIDWDVYSFMNFGSANYGALKKIGFSQNDVRYLSYLLSKVIYKHYGTKVGMSIGQTIPGEGHAPIYTEPEPLGLDASAIKSAGVIHFAIYDLQGIVDKPNPEEWILAVKDAPPQKPRFSLKAVSLWNSIKLGAWILQAYRVLNGN